MIGNSLQQIDLSNNNLQGQLPRALVNNRRLEFFDVSYNNINDSFPFWMGELPELKVLSLSNNEFHGDIRCSGNMTCTFSILHILDLSHNDFSGSFPTEMIQSWKAMNTSNASQLQYRLQKFYSLIAIDISSNKISGEIPQMIGELKGLVLLNLSNNMLIGSIPSSLGKLSNLEALDLSLNSLSGKIPQQLAQITFLEYLNVSFNNLTGPIPQNNQFSTFKGGDQLLKKCIDPAGPSTSDDDDDDSKSFIELYWTVVLIGYGGGLVAGVALGNTYFLQVFAWCCEFVEKHTNINLMCGAN
ncbi:putative leucine-rich repeat domain, L domain-containing protein [Medicago truncatula]|uniref:Putative leucine-rich repeat domain, L domain-containing protein n=1 Tax=Medicago truncatula TaxID=3880 RepID=A0A396GST7_MEDTR|nr:putative leucine-rich repeat domain, L domain-containing protein [Medicago truncatula]